MRPAWMNAIGWRRRVWLGIGLVGVWMCVQGGWTPAKAWVAQRLLERAWQRAADGESTPRPWPWSDTWPVARLLAPAHDVSLIVLEGATGATLAFGPGRHSAGAPVAGAGNVVLAAHRDTHFRFLGDVRVGDTLLLEGPGGASVEYRVRVARVAHETETGLLEDSDNPTLTLLTCYPFDAPLPGGPWRYAVVAERYG